MPLSFLDFKGKDSFRLNSYFRAAEILPGQGNTVPWRGLIYSCDGGKTIWGFLRERLLAVIFKNVFEGLLSKWGLKWRPSFRTPPPITRVCFSLWKRVWVLFHCFVQQNNQGRILTFGITVLQLCNLFLDVFAGWSLPWDRNGLHHLRLCQPVFWHQFHCFLVGGILPFQGKT